MGQITEITLKDIRCFSGIQSAKIGRITLLLGENSSGKTTFLGCYNTLARLANFIDLDDKNYFNNPPFLMGDFDTVVRSGRPRFEIGGVFDNHCHDRATFTFTRGSKGSPIEARVQLGFKGNRGETKELDIERFSEHRFFRFKESGFRFELDQSEVSFESISTWLSRYVRRGILPFHGEPSDFRRRQVWARALSDDVAFGKFVSFLRSELPLPQEPSFVIEAPDPSQQCQRRRQYTSLPAYLDTSRGADLCFATQVGTKLGLWDEILIRSKPEDRSVQVYIRIAGAWRNLIDVGYGVHSLLPLLHAVSQGDPETVFLLQHPEVHLHPSAQAKLAQFMAESKGGFLIETHSEHFTDRFRICVLEGVISREELSIVYFDRSSDGKRTQIHSIGVDDFANLVNVPNRYRSFFLLETERLLGFNGKED